MPRAACRDAWEDFLIGRALVALWLGGVLLWTAPRAGAQIVAPAGRTLFNRAVTVRASGEAGPALARALAADRFTVIEVELPRRAYDGLF